MDGMSSDRKILDHRQLLSKMSKEGLSMSFGQKLNHWLQSGGDITRLWKYCLVITVVLYPLGLIIPFIGSIWAFVMALAVVGTIILLAGLSQKGKARIDAEEYLKVKEEHEAKKREGL